MIVANMNWHRNSFFQNLNKIYEKDFINFIIGRFDGFLLRQ